MLIATMGIIIVLTGLALVFSRQMRVEALASGNLLSAVQTDGIVNGASQHVLNRLASNQNRLTLDTEIQSEAVPVGEGQFWIVRPDPEDERRYSYGIVDEASKLNINTATLDMLLLLPGMTPELAAAIIDWRDEDDVVTEGGGAESEYYLLQPDPYYCKNAPFETLDELRLIKGALPEVLYGVDANRNGVVDGSEVEEGSQLGAMNGQAQCGICKYLTVYTVEPNTSQSGERRLYVGDTQSSTMTALAVLLSRTIPADRVAAIVNKLRGGAAPTSVLDFYQKTGMTIDEFRPVADLITTERARVLRGQINVNTASREVLRCLPGLDDADVDLIIAKRALNGSDLESMSWIAEALSPTKAAQIGEWITARSFQYSADIVGINGNGRGFKRVRHVFDMRSTPPRIVYSKDATHLGWPLGEELLAAVKAGGGNAQAGANMYSMERR